MNYAKLREEQLKSAVREDFFANYKYTQLGNELWRYYHAQKGALPDASFYDIRKHFQGVDSKGHMKSDPEDSTYMDLIATLRTRQKNLAKQIEAKVYQYGFLK